MGGPVFPGAVRRGQIAGVIDKWQQKALVRLNRAGANIRSLQGTCARQSHDFDKYAAPGSTNG